jgi:hypothetical protein
LNRAKSLLFGFGQNPSSSALQYPAYQSLKIERPVWTGLSKLGESIQLSGSLSSPSDHTPIATYFTVMKNSVNAVAFFMDDEPKMSQLPSDTKQDVSLL